MMPNETHSVSSPEGWLEKEAEFISKAIEGKDKPSITALILNMLRVIAFTERARGFYEGVGKMCDAAKYHTHPQDMDAIPCELCVLIASYEQTKREQAAWDESRGKEAKTV